MHPQTDAEIRSANETDSQQPSRFGAWRGLLAASVLALTLWWVLRQPSPNYRTEPLDFYTWEGTSTLAAGRNEVHAVPLVTARRSDGLWEHSLVLHPADSKQNPGLRMGHESYVPEFRIDFAALRSLGFYFEFAAGDDQPWQDNRVVPIVSARIEGPGLEFVLPEPARLKRGALAEFFRTAAGSTNTPATGTNAAAREFRLVVVSADNSPLYLRSLLFPTEPGADLLNYPPRGCLVGEAPTPQAFPPGWRVYFYPRGRYTLPLAEPPPRRAALVAGIWGLKDAGALWTLLLGACGLFGLGCALFPFQAKGDEGWAISWNAGLGIASALGGLGLVAAVLTMPFHATDEIRHAFSFTRLVGDSGLQAEWLKFGKETHFERLHLRSDEKYTADTAAHPAEFFLNEGTLSPEAGNSYFQDYHRRSPLTAWLWHAGYWLLPTGQPRLAFLALRLESLGFVCFSAALLAAMLARFNPGGTGATLAWFVLLIPALPSWAVNISNYPLLVGSALMMSVAVLRPLAGANSGTIAAGIAGLALGCVLHISLNALPLIAGFALWLGHRPLVRLLEDPTLARISRRQMVTWWLFFAGGFTVVRFISTGAYNEELRKALLPLMKHLPGWLSEPAVLLITAGAVLAVLELSASGVAATKFGAHLRRFTSALAGLAWVPALALAAVMVACIFLPVPSLKDFETPWRRYPNFAASGHPLRNYTEMNDPVQIPKRLEAVRQTLLAVVTSLGPGHRDFIVSGAFWNGFLQGELRLPAWIPTVASLIFSLGLLRWLANAARGKTSRQGILLLFGAAACVLTVAGLAAGYWPRNLHARYLTGFYLLFLGGCFAGWLPRLGRTERAWMFRPAALIGLTLLLHGASMVALVERFY
jgi:hypothetical protein